MRILHFADLITLVARPVQPGTDREPLPPPRPRASAMLPSHETRNRPLVHEVVPAPDRKTWHVHLVEKQGGALDATMDIFLVPVSETQTRVTVSGQYLFSAPPNTWVFESGGSAAAGRVFALWLLISFVFFL